MANEYILMNKNTQLAILEIAPNGYIMDVKSVITPEAFPVSVYNEDGKALITSLNNWWHGRSIPASRDGLKQLLYLLDIDTTSQLSLKSLGLSLSDQYWLCPLGNELTWDSVNFFTNDFSRELGESFFDQLSANPSINPLSPDASSNGWLKKKWVIIDGKRYLAKAGTAPLLQQPYNEVAASEVLDYLQFNHVGYKLIQEHNRPLCLCPNFIDENTELVPASLVKNVIKKRNDESEYTHFLRCTEFLRIPNVEAFINAMLLFDYLIENTDRHYGNFGFIRDVNTLEFLGPAPIFDNGTSLWCEAPLPEVGGWQYCMPFKHTHKEQLKLLKDIPVNNVSFNIVPEIVYANLSASPYIDAARLCKIKEGVESRVRLLSAL